MTVELVPEELGFPIEIGNSRSPNARWSTSSRARPPSLPNSPAATVSPSATRSAGPWHGAGRSRAAGAAGDRRGDGTAQDQEFVLYHSDNVQASGFVEHLKLPHYVDFQGELEILRRLRARPAEADPAREAAE